MYDDERLSADEAGGFSLFVRPTANAVATAAAAKYGDERRGGTGTCSRVGIAGEMCSEYDATGRVYEIGPRSDLFDSSGLGSVGEGSVAVPPVDSPSYPPVISLGWRLRFLRPRWVMR